ncbi:putative ubiquitin-like-specific protease 1B isoform X1 [Bidens hawaiensis]|uniref:putative ubiquitin-like-specific protease 1B isoform X1 n=1 Tax=Bidens hawaiensis TaxID=980011 RepID=UPI0040499A75
MGALISNRNKRDASSQHSPCGFDHNLHINKKLNSSSSHSNVSRLGLYPKTWVLREIHAPCRFISGFTAKLSRLYDIKLGLFGDLGNALFSKCKNLREPAIRRCKNVKSDSGTSSIEVIDVDDDNDDEDDSGGSSVEVIEIVEDEREEQSNNVSVERREIVARYMELDQKEGVIDLDDELPLHKNLHNESVEKRDPSLSRLRFDIKLLEAKLALRQQARPVKKKEDVENDLFRPLTEEEEEMVANALLYSDRNKVLVNHENSNITITGQLLQCLSPHAWLNDEVINLYLELLKERENREPKKFLKCHFFNTFFYKKLVSGKNGYDYNSVRRWTTQKKLGYGLFECDKIFVPIHKEIHWCLAVINKKEEKFQYLDSLGGADKKVLRMLAKYITDEVKDKSGKSIDVTSWDQEFVTDLPNQENGYDCGMFMIKYADFYSRGIGLCFSQEHMPYFRLRTAKEILELRAN